MAADARLKIVEELVAEFVEERVRHQPAQTFSLDELKRALGVILRDADQVIELQSSDDKWLSDWLGQHPFLLGGRGGPWKAGFNRRASAQA
jgi:hypothetical protein